MNQIIRTYLIELSRKRINQTVTYQKLSDDCNLRLNMRENPHDRVIIGNLLGDISVYEHENGKRPLLSALVIRLNDGEEGEGFYKLAERLGYGRIKKLKDDLFEHEQIAKCIEFWTNEDNYLKFKNVK